MLATFFAGVLLVGQTLGRDHSSLSRALLGDSVLEDPTLSHNVSSCPGYTLSSLQETETGLTAQLSLSGDACNAFGHDVVNLTLEVTYDTETRLHVNIYDTVDSQFTIPSSVIELAPGSNDSSLKNNSDLVFNYESSPFAFWITRRSEPDGQPLFDTRISSLPQTPIPPVRSTDNSTALDGFPLVFEDQYLQLTSALPIDTNVYGLGEVIANSGFRRAVGPGNGTIQTLWARDIADPVDENVQPLIVSHSSAGSDILLLTPPSSNVSLIEYRLLGGTLDFYFFSGPSPQKVVQKMRDADIPLEVMWNDIDLYHALRDFTSDPVSFPADEMKSFIEELASKNQHYIPIVDAAVAHTVNDTDIYDPYTRGVEMDVWIKNPDGSEYVGQVWPGYTVFPDWFSENATALWTEALTNWSNSGIEFSGIWLDMNEASSFCVGSCGTGADFSNTSVPFLLPGQPGNLVSSYPEGYNATVWGPSGNITVGGTSTYGNNFGPVGTLSRRGVGAGNQTDVDLNYPPYAIHNGFGRLAEHTLATNATHAGGYVELDVHNLWGLMEEKATHLALLSLRKGKRPFIISRSTFASSGKWTGHWLGDNFSLWEYMYYNIQGVLQFQLFQVPMVGADTCGFHGNTDEELCNRWMQLSAFMPFYRNHNGMGAISQEPYVWDSVANASRTAMQVRYSMLPYWYTLFANASTYGTPPVRALFFEFPNEPELFGIDRQFLIGSDILVTPVLKPNISTVDGIFPGRGSVVWRDWYTHQVVNATAGANTTLDAPLGHINVHVRDGAAILLHAEPAYTTAETRAGPYALLVTQDASGYAFGTAYVDDGESVPPTPHTTITFQAQKGQLAISSTGDYIVEQKLDTVTVLGVGADKPGSVQVDGQDVDESSWEFDAGLERLVVKGLGVDLNKGASLTWA
ncbi:hypothetical protein L227DRAFT_560555 [Lentinus tigrinus ALCF2SS1-6]|uniref:Uncharacterized protein n=1 Tax=Lentinus tigrinus ALCF2SS1-6 TaxID=1328759 RepID=A0A5C2SLP4_9APHY|nr:hypothetical protein L227DRAFT_560555 [Lentinus tigrinus ALCF2SS1-6]